MGDAAFAKERTFTLVGAIDELVNQHERARSEFFPKRAAGRQRNQVGHPGAFQNIDIGAIIDVGGRQPVALVVARQEHDRQAGNRAAPQGCRRFTPGTPDHLFASVLQPRQIVDAGAADDAQYRLRHACSTPFAPSQSREEAMPVLHRFWNGGWDQEVPSGGCAPALLIMPRPPTAAGSRPCAPASRRTGSSPV